MTKHSDATEFVQWCADNEVPLPPVTRPIRVGSSGIGPLPKFLKRVPGDAGRKMAAKRKASWKPTKAMKEAAEKDSAKREIEDNRPFVLAAIRDGADTFNKIRKATEFDTATINKALRYYIKHRYVFKTGRRYSAP